MHACILSDRSRGAWTPSRLAAAILAFVPALLANLHLATSKPPVTSLSATAATATATTTAATTTAASSLEMSATLGAEPSTSDAPSVASFFRSTFLRGYSRQTRVEAGLVQPEGWPLWPCSQPSEADAAAARSAAEQVVYPPRG